MSNGKQTKERRGEEKRGEERRGKERRGEKEKGEKDRRGEKRGGKRRGIWPGLPLLLVGAFCVRVRDIPDGGVRMGLELNRQGGLQASRLGCV